MNSEPSPTPPEDPALAVAERQLAMLGELAQIAMTVTRAFGELAVASAATAKGILTDEFFMPEIGRARACGAKEAAESFQKVSRALRLTLMLETATVEALRDLRAGVVAPRRASDGAAEAAKPARIVIDAGETPPVPRLDAEDEGVAGRLERPGAERERAFDTEYPERLPKGAYVAVVDDLAADVGATVNWDRSTVEAPEPGSLKPDASRADRPGRTEAEPPGPATRERALAFSP